MSEDYYIETQDSGITVSSDVVNQISEYLIAKVESKEELNELIVHQANEQHARKEAWKLAYREIPLPPPSMPLEARREVQEKRNELAEKYYQEFMHK